jgi:TldD protein
VEDTDADVKRAAQIMEIAAKESVIPFTIFLERTCRRQLRWADGQVLSTRSGLDAGIALRFAADRPAAIVLPLTPLSGAQERALIREAANASSTSDQAGDIQRASRHAPPGSSDAGPPGGHALPDVDTIDALGELAAAARAGVRDARPDASVTVGYSDTYQRIVAAAPGAQSLRADLRSRRRLIIQATATTAEGYPVTTFGAPGRSGRVPGWSANDAYALGAEVGSSLTRKLTAIAFPGGQVTTVLGPGCGGILAHETIGHQLEADSVISGSYFAPDAVGRPVASAEITVIDDPTCADTWIQVGCDDEGTSPQPVSLVSQGRIAGFLTDAQTSGRLGQPNTGHARRDSYAHDVRPRMTNTYIVPGHTAPQDLVADIEFGIYITELDFGETPTSTHRFNLLATEAYLIERGQISVPVWGALLHGDTSVLGSIVGVANDMEWRSAMCNKDGSWVPVAYGSPTIRLGEMQVSGEG